jgi:hypothetical protein
MSLLSDRAQASYGAKFKKGAARVAKNLGVPTDWLLAAMAWETGWPPGFKSNGPPWPLNPGGDNGFGLIGFTPPKDKDGHALPPQTMPQWPHGPVEQLDDVENHYNFWMQKLGITAFRFSEDFYLITRGPAAIGQPDSYSKGLGDGKNKGQVLAIYRSYLKAVNVSTEQGIDADIDADHADIVGNWDVEIGPWKGLFVFESTGGAPGIYTQGGSVYWMDMTSTTKHRGSWWVQADGIYWSFDDDPQGFRRFFHVNLPLQSVMNGSVQPSGFFKMHKANAD